MRAVGSVEAVVAGQVLAGRFRVESELGEGGMARVYRVVDLATQRPYALKLLKASIADDREAVARLRREAEVLSTIDNPAVVGIETYGQLPDGRLFLVIELLEGETLGARMRRDQRLAPEALSPIVAGVAAGLGAAHRAGVVHRDLKPDNVFLARAPDGSVQVKILDFGISKVYSNEERLTRTGQVLGTPRYMAPEQLSAEPDLDGRTDVYALGVILYEALAGTPPFVAATPSDLILAILHGKITPLRVMRPELPAELESIVARAMARHRNLRYASPVELAEAWLSLVAAPAKNAPRPGMATKLVGSGGLLGTVEPELVRADPTPAPGFRIATFSELEQQNPVEPPKAVTTPLRAPTPTRIGESEPLPPAPAVLPAQSPIPAEAPPTEAPPTEAPPASASASWGAVDPRGESTDVVLPTTGGRWLWVALALLAGALTAGVALALLGSADAESSVAPPSTRVASGAIDVATDPVAGPVGDSATRPTATPPTTALPTTALPTTVSGLADSPPAGQEPPVSNGESEATLAALDSRESARPSSQATPRRATRGPRRATTTETTTSAPTPTMAPTEAELPPAPFVSSAPDAMADARAALRAGDPRRCLAILDAASLPPSAARLRLEGDCFRDSGQGREAVKAYERICELYPAFGAIEEVRAEAARLGGRCR